MRLQKFFLFFAVVAIVACGGSDGDANPDPDPPVIPAPSAATLVFPENNTECNISTILNDTQSTVTFQWNASENTDSYVVTIRNLTTNTIITSDATVTETAVTIQRGTPYEWSVVSEADGTNETATSETFRFFNEGPGIENYAPFPAEAISPGRGETIPSTNMVTLEWSATDIDNDALSFNVLFGTDANPTTAIGGVMGNSVEIMTTSGTTYFWRVITTDVANNTSQSEIFQFRVN